VSNQLNFTLQQQQQTEWCWAAVATSICLFYSPGGGQSQCDLANGQLGQTTCCQDGSTAACNQPWYLDSALSATGNLDHYTSSPAPLQDIGQQVDGSRPLAIRIGWEGGGGHFIVITGYDDSAPGNEMIAINDPVSGPSIWSYNSLVSSYEGSGTWTHSYFTQP
jgi:papain like cysteine protease AvrRpt2